MKKSSAIYTVAIGLFVASFLFFRNAYTEMQRYSELTNRSLLVFSDFQGLSRLLANAAITNPELSKEKNSHIFFADSSAISKQIEQLNRDVADSVNIRIAKQLDVLIRPEISWLLKSNVPDSILHHSSDKHLANLRKIDSLIMGGIARTRFLFQYRDQKLKAAIDDVKARIIFLLAFACVLLIYVSISLYRQRLKRMQHEETLVRQEVQFKAMVENNQDLIVIVDENLNVIYRSPSAERITGFKNEERQRSQNLQEVHPDDMQKIRDYVSEMKLNPGKTISANYRVRHKDGHYVDLEGTYSSLFNYPGLNGIVINMKDVTERKAAEKDLKKSEMRFRRTLEDMMEGVQLIGFDWKYIYVNDALTRYSVYKSQDMIGRSVMDLYPGVEQTELYAALKACMEHRSSTHLETEFIFPDGSKRDFELSIQPVPEGIFILSVDISERKKAEQELQKNVRELSDFKYALDEASIVALTDQKGIIKHVNDNFCKISGYSKEELIGQDHRIINSGYHPGDFIRGLWTTIAKGQIWKGELKNKTKDGSIYWVDTTIIPFLNAQGKPYQYLAIRSDITARKNAEEELQKHIQELSDYKYGLDEASIVAITDQKGIIKHVNDNFCDISRYSREELIGQDHRIINSTHHSKEFIRSIWTTIANGRIWKGELRNKAKDGSIYWVDTTIIPFLNKEGKPYQYLAIRSDITEKKKVEEENLKLNRLYAFLSAINQSIVHTNSDTELLQRVCDVAVDIGGFKMARIEMLTAPGIVKTANISGQNENSNEKVKQHATDYTAPIFCDTPMGKTLKSESWEVNNDLCGDPALTGLSETLRQMGILSSISLPIRKSGKMIGVFNISSSQIGFFDSREIDLVLEAAGDISFALDNFERNRQHQQAEALVISNEKRFRTLIEKSTDMKVLTNVDGNFVYASPSISKVFGYKQEEFLHHPALSFFHPDDMNDHLERRKVILASPGASTLFQFRIKHKDGHWIWCEGTFTNMLHDPAINALVSNFRDITERKEAEAQKEFDNNNFQALINNTQDLSWSLDPDLRIISFNKPFYEVIKTFTGKEIKQGDDVLDAALSGEHKIRFRELYTRALKGEIFTVTDVVEGAYAAEISFYPIMKGDKIIGSACHSRDISRRLKSEKEREKMMADMVRYSKHLEQFAYIVSHNLRSPVAQILGLSNLMKSTISQSDRERSQDMLYGAVDQLDITVKDLNKILEMRANANQNWESVDLNEVLEGIKLSIRNTIEGEKVRIENNFLITNIRSIKSYIHSIFYNLITNSIKYCRDDQVPIISISTSQHEGNILLVFKDNSRGMDLEQYGNKVFGLYQRFHFHVSGKGMGLFMVKSQVEALEGTIGVKSKPGEGTEFTIVLPITGMA